MAYDPKPTPVGSYPGAMTLSNPGLESGSVSPWAYRTGDNAAQTPSVLTSGGGRTPQTGTYFLNTNTRTTTATNGQNYISTGKQNIDAGFLTDIDAGIVEAVIQAYHINGTTNVNDLSKLSVWVFDASDVLLLGKLFDTTKPTAWTAESLTLMLPPGARKIEIGVWGTRAGASGGHQNYWDTFSVTLNADKSHKLLAFQKADADWTNYGGGDVLGNGQGIDANFYSVLGHSQGNSSNSGGAHRSWGRSGRFDYATREAAASGVLDFKLSSEIYTPSASYSARIGMAFYDAAGSQTGSTVWSNGGTLTQYTVRTLVEITGSVPTDAVSWRLLAESTTGNTAVGDRPQYVATQLEVSSSSADLYGDNQPSIVEITSAQRDTVPGAYSLKIARPRRVVPGSVMLAFVQGGASTSDIDPASGWTEVYSLAYNNSYGALFWKVAGGSEPEYYTFPVAGATGTWGAILLLENADNVFPIDVSGTAGGTNATAHVAPSVTTTGVNELIIRADCAALNTTDLTAPGSTTLVAEGKTRAATTGATGAQITAMIVSALQAVAGATGTATFTSSVSCHRNAQTVAVRPGRSPISAAPVVGAVPSIVDEKHATLGSGATSIVVNCPTHVAGDFLLAEIAVGNSSTAASITPPSGWTLLITRKYGNSNTAIFWKWATGSEPSTYTFTWTGSTQGGAAIISVRNVNPDIPILSFDINGQGSNAASFYGHLPSVYYTNTLAIGFVHAGWGQSQTVTPPSGSTEIYDFFSTGFSEGALLEAAWKEYDGPIGIATDSWDFVPTTSLNYTLTTVLLCPILAISGSEVTGISPVNGSTSGGTLVTVTGVDLDDTTGVLFDGTPATSVTVVNSSTVTCVTPAHATGTVDLTVELPTGDIVLAAAFTYVEGFVSLTPVEGLTTGGTPVSLTGVGFLLADDVLFGIVSADNVVVVSDILITCDTPPHAAGPVTVTVVRPSPLTNMSLVDSFLYSSGSIVSVAPNKGTSYGGTPVTITGTGFGGVTDVKFGGISADDIVIVDPTTITCTTPMGSPAHALGLVDVLLVHVDGDIEAPYAFEYVNSVPIITQIPINIIERRAQGARVTQIPINIVYVPPKPGRLTQIPINVSALMEGDGPKALLPTWPIMERWQWLTTVVKSISGREQRMSARIEPHQSFAYDLVLFDDIDRQTILQTLWRHMGRMLHYPLFVYRTRTLSDAYIGDTTLDVDLADSNFREDEAVVLFNVDLTFFHVLQADIVLSPSGIALAEPLAFDVPAGTMIAPAPLCRINDGQSFSMASFTGSSSIEFTALASRELLRPSQSVSFTTLDGLAILDKTYISESVDESLNKNLETRDNRISNPVDYKRWYQPQAVSTRQYLSDSDEMDFWRQFADLVKGSRGTFLAPTYREAFTLSSVPALNATILYTQDVYIAELMESLSNRYLRIERANGVIYRRVVDAILLLDGRVRVTLAQSIGNTTGSNVISSISIVQKVRLADDMIEIEHNPNHLVVSFNIATVEQ